jgi:hypothetical protein
MADITPAHVPALHEFDRLLAHGPHYQKLAWQGALAGGVLSLFMGSAGARGKLGHAAAYAVAGTGFAIGGGYLLFKLGEFVSDKSHDAIAGEFRSGWHGSFGRQEDRGWDHHGWGRRQRG